MPDQHLQQRVIRQVEQCYLHAEQQLQQSFPRPLVRFNQRGKIAGSARLQTNELRFNPVLLADNSDQFIDHVVPHEICHLLVHQLYGKVRPHGSEWQKLMTDLYQLPAKTRHSMDVSKVQGKVFDYRCGCQSHQLSIRRHNKVKAGVTYQCRRCGQLLQHS
ncbi:SprT family zinc-dependent metalloprotease [Neptunicella sp. SCSIO 80796]|uniref:SprT family zinc-dependent metalloprotease n=1 Tax=Neptunicella plasticusilytica TaxID=3117012 RepID=UPI003A4E2F27